MELDECDVHSKRFAIAQSLRKSTLSSTNRVARASRCVGGLSRASDYMTKVRFFKVLFSAPTESYIYAQYKVKKGVVLPEDEEPKNAGRVFAVFSGVLSLHHILRATSLNNYHNRPVYR